MRNLGATVGLDRPPGMLAVNMLAKVKEVGWPSHRLTAAVARSSPNGDSPTLAAA